VCFGGWDVELTPRSLVSQPVMEVIEQVNLVDVAQSSVALTIQESIALANRLASLRETTQTRPDQQRSPQEFTRPLPEQDRYDEGRYDDVDRNRPYQYDNRSDGDRILQFG
jgi:hypothetical protein